MKEKDLNTLINNNFKEHGFSAKIPDPMFIQSDKQRFNLKRPFDGFSVPGHKSIYWETKILQGYQAFAFSKISEHQMDNLLKIGVRSAVCPKCGYGHEPHILAIVILGIYLYRVGFDLFFFDPRWIDAVKSIGRKSIMKYELEKLRFADQYLPLRKKVFEVKERPHKIVWGI